MVLADLFGPDLIIVVVVLLVLMFGGPRLARNLGAAKTEFEKGLKNSKTSAADAPKPDETPSGDEK